MFSFPASACSQLTVSDILWNDARVSAAAARPAPRSTPRTPTLSYPEYLSWGYVTDTSSASMCRCGKFFRTDAEIFPIRTSASTYSLQYLSAVPVRKSVPRRHCTAARSTAATAAAAISAVRTARCFPRALPFFPLSILFLSILKPYRQYPDVSRGSYTPKHEYTDKTAIISDFRIGKVR